MSITLQQGQQHTLDSVAFDLSNVMIGLGWDIRQDQWGFFRRLLGKKNENFDLDIACFILNEHGKVAKLGSDRLVGGDVIFFSNKVHASGKVWLSGDNRAGSAEGDAEQIVARLQTAGPDIHRLIFVVTIYDAHKKGQHFGQLKNAFIHATDAAGTEIVRYQLSGKTYQNKCSMLFAEVYRERGQWKFKAVGEGYEADSFVGLLRRYV